MAKVALRFGCVKQSKNLKMYILDTYITVLLLDKFEERGHVRPAKMVDGLQPREHTATL